MRFKIKEKARQELNERRLIRKFLLFPLWLNDEVRWLEFAEIVQVYGKKRKCMPGLFQYKTQRWIDKRWAESDEKYIYAKQRGLDYSKIELIKENSGEIMGHAEFGEGQADLESDYNFGEIHPMSQATQNHA